MSFANPLCLLAIIPFLFLLIFLKKIEKKRYLNIPTEIIVKRTVGMKTFVRKAGRFLWITAVILIAVALARPQDVAEVGKIGIEGRMMILSIDLSYSMSSSSYSRTKRPAVDVIKELSMEFIRKRATTDLIGITAYGGKSRGRENGESAVILFPTTEYAQLEASIKLLKYDLFQTVSYTAIGDGIFLSILSLMDPDTLKKINIERLAKSIENEDKSYALDVVRKLKRYRNKIIVIFTDGKNNAGIEPIYPLWLAKTLGIKVHFAELESTGSTGLSEKEEQEAVAKLVNGVQETGGKYFKMSVIEQAREFYEEVDRLETAGLEFTSSEIKKDLYFWPALLALILIATAIVLENTFPRIQ